MGITPLELGLAVLAVFIVFGPKKLPSFKRPAVHVPVERERNFNFAPSQYAAGRAPSPVAQRRIGAHGAPEDHQFAMAFGSGSAGGSGQRLSPAPLPHELGFYS
ncbi:MAG: Sec-independent protein translocase subunit TatA/TatB [Solirubrobacterales bacterium]